jgi:acyl carrier protein phosphodiesterase
MNFLGHLYFSGNDKELMLANLFGDFARGSKHKHLPEVIQQGIKLHRKIDFYIDNHPLVKELKFELMSDLPKVGPIAVDLFFDHLLARNWTQFHSTEYTSFLNEFYEHETDYHSHYPAAFLDFMDKLRTHQWMNHYPTKYGLMKSCEGVAKRISFETKLPTAHLVFNQMETEIESTFHGFMEDAKKEFLTQ